MCTASCSIPIYKKRTFFFCSPLGTFLYEHWFATPTGARYFLNFFAELLGETFFLITAVIIISGRLQCRQRRSVVSPGGCCRNNNTGSALIQDVSRIDFYPKRKTWNLADSPSTKSKMRARLIDFDISVRIQPNILIQHNRIKIIIITLAIYTFPFIF